MYSGRKGVPMQLPCCLSTYFYLLGAVAAITVSSTCNTCSGTMRRHGKSVNLDPANEISLPLQWDRAEMFY